MKAKGGEGGDAKEYKKKETIKHRFVKVSRIPGRSRTDIVNDLITGRWASPFAIE
jgi:hypothetical protein